MSTSWSPGQKQAIVISVLVAMEAASFLPYLPFCFSERKPFTHQKEQLNFSAACFSWWNDLNPCVNRTYIYYDLVLNWGGSISTHVQSLLGIEQRKTLRPREKPSHLLPNSWQLNVLKINGKGLLYIPVQWSFYESDKSWVSLVASARRVMVFLSLTASW